MNHYKHGPYTAYIGIDWADSKHDVCLQAAGSEQREFACLPHQVNDIEQWALSLRRRFGGPIAIALELAQGPIVYALQKYDFLVLYHTFRELDNRTRHMAHQDPVCQRLMTTPGVGFVTALTFKAAVDDPTRFKRSRTVGAHFGLTPRRFQSGEMDNPGHISRAGDPDVRCTLYVAANAMMTRSSRWSPLKVWGMQLARQRGHKRAVVAVARKLAVILHRMWLDGTTYRWGTEGAP